MSCVHVVLFCNLIQVPEVDSFSHRCYQALSSSRVMRREPENEAATTNSQCP